MKNFKAVLEKYWWISLVILAFVATGEFKTFITAGLIGFAMWGVITKRNKMIKTMIEKSESGYVTYKGRVYTCNSDGEVYKVNKVKNY